MLPSRPTLEGWNPDSLTSSGAAIVGAGDEVERAVGRINFNIKIMPETRAWSGLAHDAATDMFERGHEQATTFSDCATAVGGAISGGASTIGGARTALLNKADEIDRGELFVNDQWVVLIDPVGMSAEQVAELMKQVAVEQDIINTLLLAVGSADDDTSRKLSAAAQRFGFHPPNPADLANRMMGVRPPADEVPNPSDSVGLFQQSIIRGEDMGMRVRETQERWTEEGHFEKTLIMQDGSEHVITEYEYDYEHGVPDMTTEEHWDTNGNLISQVSSTRTPGGYLKTISRWADGTQLVVDETPEGVRTAAFTLPDGRHGVLPPDNPLLSGPVPTGVGLALTGLEAHVDRGGRIPMLSMDAVDDVGKGAKYGGPAIGLLTTIYEVGAAETPYDSCVAGVAGTFSIAGDWAGGATGGFLGGLIPGFEPVTVPAGAIAGSYYGGEWMKSLGAKVAIPFCK